MHIRYQIESTEAQEAFERAPEVMERNLERFLSRGSQEVAREARRAAPKAFSNLVNSIHAFRMGILHWRVSPSVKHAPFVEDGTRPHFPNPESLQPWVERVLGLRNKEARGKAYLIARAINRRGTKAQPYMRPSAEKMESRVFQLLREGVDAGLREAFGQ